MDNDKYKSANYKDYHANAAGIWLPESKDPSKEIAEPQQVNITRHFDSDYEANGDKGTCVEIGVQLLATEDSVMVDEIYKQEYEIDSTTV